MRPRIYIAATGSVFGIREVLYVRGDIRRHRVIAALTNSTSVNELPTRVYGLVVRTSTTESMMLVLVARPEKRRDDGIAVMRLPAPLKPLMMSCPL